MAGKADCLAQLHHVPDDGGVVGATGYEPPAVGGEGERVDDIVVTLEQRRHLPSREVVEADGGGNRVVQTVKISSDGQLAAIRRQRQGIDRPPIARCNLAADYAHGLARLDVPNPDRLVLRGRHDLLTVWCDGQPPDVCGMPACVEYQL